MGGTLEVQDREGAIRARSIGRCGNIEMGNDSSELEGSLHP